MSNALRYVTTAAVLIAHLGGGGAWAQTSSLPTSRLTAQGDAQKAGLTVHKDPLGRPCLKFEAISRAHVINPNIYDHIVSVYNSCNKLIKTRVCYMKSDSCIDMQAQPLKRQEAVLGIYPSIRYFQYSWTEKF